ncbi:RelA/SpoT family protein [Enemella evansiae]|uniref:Bifunctional (P)ppGpp synthetase/guanosine-3',5'-bis(Diphosphate) 3'-pyrophosphohydrolase n=1 Tax=Enemella evansiae TaxID=2016499 RepID=A0A255GNB9_9ACTN|nr:bifunctional (p)ppGpp synthetase/guanosine-3',5'-bis(diphosphate) 3'-pyrophosphohydrolase [Enemella evansiae]OYO05198.1 bifunctional (p)ppGpp synthetase/guanosine-3',5'-bis(diphosphate) 3'-pyrophosphohydrolase [Enemella evansiae]OYO15660.1 bifunctional (p)ppGpp synthetase/guanosine-3',5'-bis(diphosphate) 3'-pyrophosphohydrolase [Enemella evansiae]OYO15893.1 bifunctional (p)ppGpp synthetase/guanosine-3',5'-bis(diphosphate) 3'-pyrophosphohydrolase [Enemella evansiae]OYO20646.1 bifunctional (p)
MSEAPRLSPATPAPAPASESAGATPAPPPNRLGSGPEQPRMSMRHRLARLGARQPQSAVLDPLFKVIRANHPKADTAVVERAYRTAEHYHRGQLRKSGDPYITHPLAVATILAELGMTEATLCAALLHDTVEDTSYTIEQLTADFGTEVAVMVDGVTKLDKIAYGDSAQAETIRKMVIAMAKDIRVVVIKLADRLHNMRTLHFLRPDKQTRIARDTLDIFAPLAHRLGMNAVKWELEDLSFSILQPKIYDEIVQLVAERAPQREAFLRKVTEQVNADLKAARIRATVTGRPKHYYSIYQKMVVRGRDFSDIYDLVGLRILVDTDKDCYAALGVMHVRWNPLPGRFKDYIAIPKFNMYQSLHTTVLGPDGKPVELQIRTNEMHRRAEYGVAAHWKYKETARAGGAGDDTDLNWVRSLNDWQKETTDPEEFLESLRYEINSGEVYVYTPKGDVITLPTGATPVDFAYAIHTEVGQRCIGARVNGRLVPLESELNNGDVVDVMTSKAEGAGPSRDWLSFVKSQKARNKIKHYFTRERREESIEQGREALAKQLRKAGLPMQRFLTVEHLTAVADHFKLADVSGLYAAIGEGHVSAQAVVHRLISIEGGQESAADEAAEDQPLAGRRRRTVSTVSGPGVAVAGDTDMWVKLAKCCTPVPGDDILGFITRGNGVSVHRRDCTNAAALLASPERLVDVSWAPTAESSFLVAIQVEGLDRQGMLSEVTRTVSDHHVNIISATVNTTRSRVFKARLTFETPDPTHLDALVQAVRRVPGVFDVFRVKQ